MTFTITTRRAMAAIAALLLASAALIALSGKDGSSRAVAAGYPASLSCTNSAGAFVTKGTVNNVPNAIAITAVSHGISSPRDAASGQSTGKRQHKPYTFNKVTDASSTAFIDSSVNARALPACTFRFYKTKPDGSPYLYYAVKLTNVQVSSYSFGSSSSQTESLSLNFEKITWTYAGLPPLEDCLVCVA